MDVVIHVDIHEIVVVDNHIGRGAANTAVDGFDIYVGQRYSVVVNCNQPVANYWIRGPMTLQHSSDNDNLDTDNVYAVLHYQGAPNAEPTTPADDGVDNLLQEYELAPLDNPGPPGGNIPADRSIDLAFSLDVQNGKTMWKINGISYKSPDLPTLLNIIANGYSNETDFTATEHTFVLDQDDVIELVIHGSANGHIHPFHLHGHAFDVVQSMAGPLNYINPPRRDVVGVGGSTVIIRFRADNPGPWFLHCHIDWHLEAGLAVVFAEAPSAQRSGPKAQVIKQSWLDLCPIYKALPADQQ